MAYVKKEVENVVAVIPQSNFAELRVTAIGTEEKIEAVDIRQWYWTQANPTKQITKKGIRVSVPVFKELIKTLSTVDETLLGGGDTNE